MRVVVVVLALLAGCSSGFTKDGTTVVSYCLLGGVYVDDTRVEAYRVQDDPLCPAR